jgi:hypothetical protein
MREWPPEPRHLHLLTAALCDADTACDAWHRWRAVTTIGQADPLESRLMAVVAGRLAPAAVDDTELAHLRGQRRYVWALNALRAGRSAAVADVLALQGIESCFFKGLGLLGAYGDSTVRTMHDADLIVPFAQRHEAIDVLHAAGFEAAYGEPIGSVHGFADLLPGYGMRRADGTEIDLHWRPLHELRPEPHRDEPLFRARRRIELSGAAVNVVSPSHHAVLVVGHALRWGSGAQLIGLVDLCQLLAQSDFDTAAAVELAVSYERVAPLTEALDIVDPVVGGRPHPALVDAPRRLAELRAALPSPSIADRLAHAARTSAPGRRGRRLGVLSTAWSSSLGASRVAGWPVSPAVESARRHFQLERGRDVVGHLAWRAAGRSPVAERLRPHVRRDGAPGLPLGGSIRVADGDRFTALLARGWSPPDREFAWSVAADPVVVVRPDLAAGVAGALVLGLVPFVHGAHPSITVEARVDGRRAATWRYDHEGGWPAERRLPIAGRSDGAAVEVMLVVRRPASPFSLGLSTDRRRLGVGLVSVALVPAATAEEGRVS